MPETNQFPHRRYAGVFDLRIREEVETATHGVDPSPDAIGGYYGMGWYERYEDADTGEVYEVHCTDGVNGGKSARLPGDEEWLSQCYWAIVERSQRDAKIGCRQINLSLNELKVMRGFTHAVWLQSEEGKTDGQQSETGLNGGLVGHCRGVPVMCDLKQEDNLPLRTN